MLVSTPSYLLISAMTITSQAIAHMLLTSEGSFKKEIKKLPDPDLLLKASGTVQKVDTHYLCDTHRKLCRSVFR